MLDNFGDADVAACAYSGWDSGWWIATDGLGTLSSPAGGDPLPNTLSPEQGTAPIAVYC